MKLSAKFVSTRRSPQSGFSLVELVLSLAVLLIITTLAVPVIIRSLQSYQLNSAASQLSGMLKFAKFEAIRQNTPVSCQIQQQGANWLIWVDSNGNGQPDGAEPQMVLSGSLTLLPAASVPDPSSITSALGAGGAGLPWTPLSGANAAEWYDHRGVLCFQSNPVCPTGVPTIYALYLGNPNDPSSGYRAIITLPSGAVQVWSASSAGTWQRVS
jgi:prepilin-type N-terminal cleavage/methylation domain-containing protein